MTAANILPILLWPDPRLSQRCDPVEDTQQGALIADMFATMYAAGGRGLAAPQVGVMKRLFVIDLTWKEGEKSPLAMIDPVIMGGERAMTLVDEVCLSIPGIAVPVTRPAAVTLHWTDETGATHSGEFDGAAARVIQHECDHLDGRVHFDRIAPGLCAELEGHYLSARP